MNARDMFKGKMPNTGLVSTGALENETAFAAVLGPGKAAGAVPPRLRIVLRPEGEAAPEDGPEPASRAGGSTGPGSEAPSGSPVTVLDATSQARPPASAGAGLAAPDRFAALVAPLTPAAFLESYYVEKRPVLFRGDRDRFASLVRWDDLNALLSMDLLQSPRLRLAHDRTTHPLFHCYIPDFGYGWRSGDRGGLDEHRLETLLRRGATLILDRMDELHAPVRSLAEDLEAALGSYTQINLYASWQAVQGFSTHWDNHDVFIVQVTGCKRWYLYGTTRPFPMKLDVRQELRSDAPSTVQWSEVLRAGDVFYIPRGWWHDARTESASDDEGKGSIHLTCGPRPITGIDFMRWLTARLAHHETFRRDVPMRARDNGLEAHLAALRELILSELEGDDVASRFQDHLNATWSERGSVRIGDHIEPWKSPDWDGCELRLRGARRAAFESRDAGGAATLTANGYTWSFDPECADLIAPLAAAGRMTLAGLKATTPDRFPADFVDEFARLLIEEGAAYAVLPERPPATAGT